VVNVPRFKGPMDLPFGLQVISRKYNDYLLLNFLSFLKDKNYIIDGTYPDIKEKFEAINSGTKNGKAKLS
jgi:hypothetical protein